MNRNITFHQIKKKKVHQKIKITISLLSYNRSLCQIKKDHNHIFVFKEEEHDFYCDTERNEKNMLFGIFTEIGTRLIIDQSDFKNDIVICLVISIIHIIIVVVFFSEYCNLTISYPYCFYYLLHYPFYRFKYSSRLCDHDYFYFWNPCRYFFHCRFQYRYCFTYCS